MSPTFTPDVIAAGVLALVCLLLWLLEKTPAFVPTLLLVAGAPVLLSSRGLDLGETLAAAANPVMALFFGGFVLARLVIGTWMLMFAALGWSLYAEAKVRAAPRSGSQAVAVG